MLLPNLKSSKVQEAVNPCLSTGAWGLRKEGVGEGLAEKVGERLAKGWHKVGEGLVSRFPCTLQFRNSRGARSETRVCDSMEGRNAKASYEQLIPSIPSAGILRKTGATMQ